MLQAIPITDKDIIHQVKVSCKVPEIVKEIVTCKVVEEVVAEAGIKAETDELQQAADQFRFLNQLQSAENTWAWLEKHGLSLDYFEELLYNTVISGKLATHLFADKIEPYFFEHQLDYAGIVMYEVILDDEDLGMELFYAIQENEIGFYEVAHQYIQEQELRRCGGYRGILRRQDLRPEISALVFATKPPQLLKPIVTSLGLHLILVEEIIEPQLDNKLRSQILSDLFADWVKQQIEQVEVVIELSEEQ